MASKNELIKAKVIAKAWADPEFKARLVADPRGVLMEMGMQGLEGKEVKLFEDTPGKKHVVLEQGAADNQSKE